MAIANIMQFGANANPYSEEETVILPLITVK